MYPPFGNRRWYPPRLYQLMLLEPEKFQVFSQRQLESASNNFSHLWRPPLECNSERSENSNVSLLGLLHDIILALSTLLATSIGNRLDYEISLSSLFVFDSNMKEREV